MNKALINKLADKAWKEKYITADPDYVPTEALVKLIVEETLKLVDDQVYGRGENQWYYEDDKKWIRLHFGYGELAK